MEGNYGKARLYSDVFANIRKMLRKNNKYALVLLTNSPPTAKKLV